MKETTIKKLTLLSFKNPRFVFWSIIRILSAIAPLINTYLFSLGVKSLETHKGLKETLQIFAVFLGILIIENITRILSKTRITIYAENTLITIQEEIIAFINPATEKRKEIIQAIRNLTQALRGFIDYTLNTGIAGIVSFLSVPVILFFIDKRIFGLEVILILIYLLITGVFERIYEKLFEILDKARECYFANLFVTNAVEEEATYVKKTVKDLENLTFFGWVSLQNLVALFQFLIIALVVLDYIQGKKQISDLVLIVGYINNSQIFLNSLTNTLQKVMEIKAGTERLAIVSEKISELV